VIPLPRPKPDPNLVPLDDQYAELIEVVFRQERLARRWGWLNGGSGPSHVCRPPSERTASWTCGCGQVWLHELGSGWLPKT
jgi:hypothetical protein